ncbi:MAG: (2Fe-2S) ferredoxin domain-containing protein [Kiritimatiellae bacterium]|jgi:NADP-reducing hydrogenase subunit HndB|nr:(2Fe-2S) ferredoxin domain-containing protein [Kiritimatiellia bacterium]NLD90848.1 (2Fe-2S) ferredoxin domain-containing protein [Lentisphaerota bacterium]HPC20157.1 (2Fe-2S) ferredoxin domain-containing protein [Kiritimatiellia bacterium]HQQ59719.1 (2Fe-2S) ferredoxin domain-containing protein [Kiritimatiellia bacterium]
MAKLKLADLRKLRAACAAGGASAGQVRITVGLGTCGIAAGAADLLALFEKELAKVGLGAVQIRRTGCMGLCHSEPTVEVAVPGMPTVVYGRVDAETARKIVNQHLGRKLLVNDHIFDKPVADLPGRKA